MNGESWIEFTLYEFLGFKIGFLLRSANEIHTNDLRNDSLYQLRNGAKFRIYNLGGNYSLLVNDGDESLIEEYVEFNDLPSDKVSEQFKFLLSELIQDGAANRRYRLSK